MLSGRWNGLSASEGVRLRAERDRGGEPTTFKITMGGVRAGDGNRTHYLLLGKETF